MTFEEIPARMAKLRVNRKWLMEACNYSKSTLASTLSAKGSNRNERSLKTIWEALDREEERQCCAHNDRHADSYRKLHSRQDSNPDCCALPSAE